MDTVSWEKRQWYLPQVELTFVPVSFYEISLMHIKFFRYSHVQYKTIITYIDRPSCSHSGVLFPLFQPKECDLLLVHGIDFNVVGSQRLSEN